VRCAARPADPRLVLVAVARVPLVLVRSPARAKPGAGSAGGGARAPQVLVRSPARAKPGAGGASARATLFTAGFDPGG
jgi:hypothetical protein